MDDDFENTCENYKSKESKMTKITVNNSQAKKEEMDIMTEIERLKLKLEMDFKKYSNTTTNRKNKESKTTYDTQDLFKNIYNDNCVNTSPVIIHKGINEIDKQYHNTNINLNEENNNKSFNNFNTISDVPEAPETTKTQEIVIVKKDNKNNTAIAHFSEDNSNSAYDTQDDLTKLDKKLFENQLTIDERLSHEIREIRKNACKEVAEMCLENTSKETQKDFFDCFHP